MPCNFLHHRSSAATGCMELTCFSDLYVTLTCVCLQIEAQEYLGSCSCPQYMEKAERRLHEEKERVDNYLDPSSEPKITRVVENELIKKQVTCPYVFLIATDGQMGWLICSRCSTRSFACPPCTLSRTSLCDKGVLTC